MAAIELFAVNCMLSKLVAFSEESMVMILGVKNELNKSESRMKDIAAYLNEVEKKKITYQFESHFLNKLKDVMHDFDDTIEFWIYKNQLSSFRSPACCIFPLYSFIQSIHVRHEVAQQIKTLNYRLDDIFGVMRNLNQQHLQTESLAYESSNLINVDIVGHEIEESANKLVKMAITDDQQEFSLIAITGMGGIGKSTLANKIYDDTRIKNRYSVQMWLSVTQNYSCAQMIKVAIRNVGGNHANAEKKSELFPILANAIAGKSFFLVVDDVWNSNSVESLLNIINVLKSTATSGFILLTTRDQRVAMQMGAKYIHKLKVLSAKSAWELLRKNSYLTNASDIQHFQDVGKKIVQKCGGLPLAIITLAHFLATTKENKIEWEDVLNRSAWSISGLPKIVYKALYLSYMDLSPQLKQCFLYCSLYPPNYVMKGADLVKFWIAEGLVEERSDQTVEKTAEQYYHELIMRNLLEPTPSHADVPLCKMHVLLRSLAEYLSLEESFSAYQVLPNPNVIWRLRRLSISETNEQTSISDLVTRQMKLRTFVLFNCLSKIEMKNFRFLKLRVLHINGKGLRDIPKSIGDLIHLRMLNLNQTSISNLPESIGFLTNLLFLNLSGCEFLHALPRGITQLCNLRQFKIEDTPIISVPKGLRVLTKLTEITGFLVGGNDGHDDVQNGWNLQEFDGLSQLRRIWISKLESVRNFSNVLANKIHLKDLTLHFSNVLDREIGPVEELDNEIINKLCPPTCLEKLIIQNYSGSKFPCWMSSSSLGDHFSNLQYLTLKDWSCCTNLPPLGMLHNLKYLNVQGASSIVRIDLEFLGIGVCSSTNIITTFSKLEFLIFEDMSKWEEWLLYDVGVEKSPSGHLMPRMKQLEIIECPKLKALPDGLQQLSSIEKLVIRETHNLISIHNLTSKCEQLTLHKNNSLQTISNLPNVKMLYVVEMPNLRQVSKLDSLEYIRLKDYEIEGLPEWLVKLMEEQKDHLQNKLHLDLFCNTSLFKRCLKDGADWPIIKCFSSVSVYNKDRTASLEYIREPGSYSANF